MPSPLATYRVTRSSEVASIRRIPVTPRRFSSRRNPRVICVFPGRQISGSEIFPRFKDRLASGAESGDELAT